MKRFILAIVFVFCCSLGMTPPAEAGLISKEQEIEMGRQTAMQLEAKYGVVQDYALQERVNRIGQSLVKVSERQDLEYSFKVLNSDEVNALACPGGFIYVFKGLIDYMPSDAELAGVLGHEITHVVKKHTVHQIEKQLLTTLAFAIVTKGDLGIAGLATQALAAGYSRTDERGADKGGFNLCVAAGYNPYSVVLTINKLEDLAKEQGNPGYGIFSSHPEPEERLKRVMKQIKALKVHPEITLNEDNTARVHEGDWGFNITQTVGNDRPEYRAYMLAGGLYCVRERDKGHIDPYRFIVYDNGGSATIYYDDIEILTVYNQDAYAGGFGMGECADPKECKAIADLGVDMLAAGIGNIHGKYPANWAGLSFETLDAIQQLTGDMPLVLHGGTGIPDDMIKKAISLGVAKINVNTECQLSFAAATREYIEAGKDLEGKGFDPRKLLLPGTEAIKATVKEKMELFGSVNRA